MIRIGDYPELKLIAWSRRPDDWIDEEEALSLYEANWRFVEPERMNATEKALLARLINDYGNGVLNV